MRTSLPSRRDFVQAGTTLAAGALLGGVGTGAGRAIVAESSGAAPAAARKRSLRIAYLTDVHVQPELGAGEGFIDCLRHVQQLTDKPDVVFNGGDAIMDALAVGPERVKELWNLWHETLRQECSLPVESCIGNHDVFGWNKKKSGATGEEPTYGKAWAVEALGLPGRYRSFDRGGWHFVVLDSIHTAGRDDEGVYHGLLDEEQFAWLEGDLKAADASNPICVVSHIPILSAAAYMVPKCELTGEWRVPSAVMHLDARRIKNLFLEYPNVRLCLSGHLHLVDRVDYDGVSYLCNGAVSGSWWRGKNQECDAGFAVLDLFDDGSFDRQYVEYGWKARTA